jgi:hypothetical protein
VLLPVILVSLTLVTVFARSKLQARTWLFHNKRRLQKVQDSVLNQSRNKRDWPKG